jgi:predicted AlkP superfamily pyrophosphatase or phosphodiesterase
MARAAISSFALILLWVEITSASGPGSGGVNAPENLNKPYIVLFSIDGFRWDFPDLTHTPAMDWMAANGIKAEALQPAFPTLTFPNHFSIATGALPARHGILANEFPDENRVHWYHYKDRSTVQDGNWYRVDPLWVTAEKQGMVTAAYFFVGTEADISGIRPTHWRAFNADDEDEDRVQQALDWLGEPPETRPHVITLYTEDVDDHTHWHGPGSAQSLEAIRRVDQRLQQLLDGIATLPHGDQVYVFLVSDHGQAGYTTGKNPLVLDEIVELEGVRPVDGGPYVFLYFDNGNAGRAEEVRDAINRHWSCGRALLAGDAPATWGITQDPGYPDLLVLADPGCAVISSRDKAHKMTPGDHGWSPEMPEMRGIFYATGPRIAAGQRLGVANVTDIYPMMMSVLGLTTPHTVDGDPKWLPSLLLPVR